jgi:hypothetical protein
MSKEACLTVTAESLLSPAFAQLYFPLGGVLLAHIGHYCSETHQSISIIIIKQTRIKFIYFYGVQHQRNRKKLKKFSKNSQTHCPMEIIERRI